MNELESEEKCLLNSFGKFFIAIQQICIRSLLGRFVYSNCCNKSKNPAEEIGRAAKSFESSMPSFAGARWAMH